MMSPMEEDSNETKGMILVFVAYVIWGLFPLYWRILDGVPAVEIALHRIVWCVGFAGAIVLWRRRQAAILRIVTNPKLIGALFLSGLLVAADWAIYIWSVESRQLVEASLGLFLMPLVSILLGVTLLGEKVSPMRSVAVALGIAALTMQIVALGHMPWIAFGLAATFGFYGYVRKKTPVDPLDGLFVETSVLAPMAIAALVVVGWGGGGAFRLSHPGIDALLILGGAVTALPLALFVIGARRIRLSTVGFVQYFSPGLTLALAVFGFGETFAMADAATFACIWLALILVAVEGHLARRRASVA